MARARAFSEAVDKKRDTIIENMRQGMSFAEAAEALDVKVNESQTLTMIDFATKEKNGMLLMTPMRRLQDGGISPVVMAGSDALIVYLEQRVGGDEVQAKKMVADVTMQMRRSLMRATLEEWSKGILQQMDVHSPRLAQQSVLDDIDE